MYEQVAYEQVAYKSGTWGFLKFWANLLNIFCRRFGKKRLIGFDLAKVLGETVSVTQPNWCVNPTFNLFTVFANLANPRNGLFWPKLFPWKLTFLSPSLACNWSSCIKGSNFSCISAVAHLRLFALLLFSLSLRNPRFYIGVCNNKTSSIAASAVEHGGQLLQLRRHAYIQVAADTMDSWTVAQVCVENESTKAELMVSYQSDRSIKDRFIPLKIPRAALHFEKLIT